MWPCRVMSPPRFIQRARTKVSTCTAILRLPAFTGHPVQAYKDYKTSLSNCDELLTNWISLRKREKAHHSRKSAAKEIQCTYQLKRYAVLYSVLCTGYTTTKPFWTMESRYGRSQFSRVLSARAKRRCNLELQNCCVAFKVQRALHFIIQKAPLLIFISCLINPFSMYHNRSSVVRIRGCDSVHASPRSS